MLPFERLSQAGGWSPLCFVLTVKRTSQKLLSRGTKYIHVAWPPSWPPRWGWAGEGRLARGECCAFPMLAGQAEVTDAGFRAAPQGAGPHPSRRGVLGPRGTAGRTQGVRGSPPELSVFPFQAGPGTLIMATGVQDFNRTEFDRLNEIKGHLEIALLEKHFLRESRRGEGHDSFAALGTGWPSVDAPSRPMAS